MELVRFLPVSRKDYTRWPRIHLCDPRIEVFVSKSIKNIELTRYYSFNRIKGLNYEVESIKFHGFVEILFFFFSRINFEHFFFRFGNLTFPKT